MSLIFSELDMFLRPSKYEFQNIGECTVIFDGYYVETILFVFLGIIWLYWSKRRIYRLEDMDSSEWLVKTKPSIFENS